MVKEIQAPAADVRNDGDDEETLHRIYIGGLHPHLLKASIVADRLKRMNGINIESIDHVLDDGTFFYVNALGDESLKLITKNYHNVKWKGCRLLVQKARPHFLKRLEMEREERRKRLSEKNVPVDDDDDDVEQEEQKESTTLPRRLRIRQKFGTEAHKVDTKPCQVDDWSTFTKVMNQMRKRRQRKSKTKEEKKDKTKAFYSRAIHLRFDDKHVTSPAFEAQDQAKISSEVEEAIEEKESTTSSDESTSSADEESAEESEEENEQEKHQSKTYEWSSEEESGSDEGSKADESAEKIIENIHDDEDTSLSAEAQPASPVVQQKFSDDEPDNRIKKMDTHDEANVPGGAYEWSSSDADSSDEDEYVGRKSGTLHKEIDLTAEFSAAITFGGSDEDEEQEEQIYTASKETDVNLKTDVDSNLSVLAQLFPEMTDTAAKNVIGTQQKPAPGWGEGLMQRYDPTKDVAPTEKDKTNEKLNDSDESSGDDSDSDNVDMKTGRGEESESDAADQNNDETEKGDVYDEAKLANVFREARNTGQAGAFQVSSMFGEVPEELRKEQEEESKNEQTNTDGAFSFNFDLASAPDEDKNKSSTGFSFGFDMGKAGEEAEAPNLSDAQPDKEEEDELGVGVQGIEEEVSPEPKKSTFRRRGMLPPSDVIDRFYNDFFAMHDGEAIMENPEAFRNDPQVSEDWNKRRQALTLDWKRKRKYAQSRIQKKMKFR